MTFQPAHFPILDYDSSLSAFIDPSRVFRPLATMPETLVLCFFHEVITKLTAGLTPLYMLNSEIGDNPIFRLEHQGQAFAVLHPGVGAPLAAGFMEEAIALGAKRIIAVGGAGSLVPTLTVGHAILPTDAIRDEGTSYHYVPAARTIQPTPSAVEAIRAVFERHEVPYVAGTSWTIDALYRETPGRIAARRAEGALCVEMEMAACCAVAQFRGVTFGQILYSGDDLTGTEWNGRDWQRSEMREQLFWLAAEAALQA